MSKLIMPCVLVLLAGCSGRPSESDARAALEQKIQRQSNGLIQLLSFRETNGVERDLGIIKTYHVAYTAEIQFTEDCGWGGGGFLVGWDGNFYADPPDSLVGILGHFKAGRKGQQEQVSAYLTFLKTQNGWRLAN